MAILCCCPQLLHNKRGSQVEQDVSQHEGPQGLPASPTPATLPTPVPSGLALSPQSTTARSSLTNPLPGAEAEASVQLAELVVEDSEDDNGENDLAHTRRNRSTSTLEAVKARIRRHLSQDSIPGQSESEEQIARRAEVKRLMRKRIQEELQNENNPVPGQPSMLQKAGAPFVTSVTILGNGPRDTIEFTVDEVTKDKNLVKAQPINLSNATENDARYISRPLSQRSSACVGGKENHQLSKRPVSLRDWIELDLGATQSGHHRHVRQRSSLPELPVSPQLQPVRVASLRNSASLASWRLSLSTESLADLLTPDKTRSPFRPVVSPAESCDTVDVTFEDKSAGNDKITISPVAVCTVDTADKILPCQVPPHSPRMGRRIPKSSSLVRDESPVGLWLRAQSYQFRLSTASPLQSEHQSDDDTNGHSLTIPVDQTCVATAAHTQLDPSNTSQGSGSPTWEQIAASSALLSDAETAQAFPQEADGILCLPHHHPTAGDPLPSLSDEASRPLMPVDPGVPWQNVVFRGFAGLWLPFFRWHHLSSKGPEGSKHDLPSKAQPGTGTPNLVHSHTRRTTLRTGSENSSLRIRGEPELHAAEDRFRGSHLRDKPSVPAPSVPPGSKFHEVLSDNPRFAAENSLPKLELTLPLDLQVLIEKFDGNDAGHDLLASVVGRTSGARETVNLNTPDLGHLKVPSTEYDRPKSAAAKRLAKKNDGAHRTRGFSSSKDGDETAEMWKRALRAEPISKPPRRSPSPQPVIPKASRPDAKANSRPPRAPCPSEAGGRSGFDSSVHSPTCTELPTLDHEETFWQSLARSNTILEEWGRQLGKQEQEAVAPSHTLPSNSRGLSKKSTTPPESWARFPSHNRDERNATAGELDSVKPTDFAVRKVSAAVGMSWITDKVEDGAPGQRSIVRSVSDRFTQPFKSRWSKLVPRRLGTHIRDSSIRGARRSSIQASGDLEYPELELIPTAGGYRELLALEKEINEMKGVDEPRMRSCSDESGPDNRRSLVEKVTGILQHDGSLYIDEPKPRNTANFIKDHVSSTGTFLPMTPATLTAVSEYVQDKDLTDSSGERYATPFSHLSLSRPLTPQTTSHLQAATYTPGSTPSTASVIRHTSLTVPKRTLDLSMNINRFDSSSGRSNFRRRSASNISPGLG